MKKYYVTMYSKYPIYEPAEGGYYYSGRSIDFSCEFSEWKKAKRFLRRCYKDCIACEDHKEKGWFENVSHTRFGVNGRYIGEGWYVTLERKQGSEVSGYVPYC